MPPRRKPPRALALAVTWPLGIVLTSWSYLWRTTPLRRVETAGSWPDDAPPELPGELAAADVQDVRDGVGPLFHRRYRMHVGEARCSAEGLIERMARDLNGVAPTAFARFVRPEADGDRLHVGDELLVRMPGPWDGPVRVVSLSPSSFRLATLAGHLEAGQIEFRAYDDGQLVLEIESWARSGDRLANLLYSRLRMAKEVQLHMWVSVLERAADLASGTRVGRLEVHTRRIEEAEIGAVSRP